MIDRYQRLAILGVPIDSVSMEDAVEILDSYIRQRGFHQVATANLNFLTNSIKDKELLEILQRCSLIVPDGVPLLWAAQCMGTPFKGRVAGYSLVPRLMQLAEERGYSIYLLGASESCCAGSAAWMAKNHPGARLAGRYSPPFASLKDMNHEEMIERITQAKPDILMVAFGNPKQEKWLAMHQDQLQVPVCIGVGGSLTFLAGEINYAPPWMQRYGLEAFYRVWKEPKRLGQRYLSDLVVAFRYLMLQVLTVALQPRDKRQPRISHTLQNGTLTVTPNGSFRSSSVAECEDLLEKMSNRVSSVILDLSATKSIGPEAFGSLIGISDHLQKLGIEFTLAGISNPVRRVLSASLLSSHFRMTLP